MVKLEASNVKGDIYGGIMAAVVALPLALAFGVSSGAGAIAGIYGAVFVGFFAALFGGTPTQISGPTGPMTVVMTATITSYISQYPETGLMLAFTVVTMGGLFQILFGLLKLGKYVSMVPYAVISGFMSGIGIIIIILQVPSLFGQDIHGSILSVLIAVPDLVANINLQELGIGLFAIAIIYFWPKKIEKLMPAQLFALIFIGLIGAIFLPVDSIRILGEMPTGLPGFHMPTYEPSLLIDMLESAIILALLGSIDSLLTSLVADNITNTRHNPEQELIGQGIGNVIAGFFGGLPGAGATMRTVVNTRNGGITNLSGMVHAVLLLAIIMGLGQYASHIPHAVLAAILFTVGIDIIDWSVLRRIKKFPPRIIVTMLTVLFLTVFVDLITAVAVGITLSSLSTIRRMADLQEKLTQEVTPQNAANFLSAAEVSAYERVKDHVLLFKFRGVLSFGAARNMLARLNKKGQHTVLVLDMSLVTMVDVTTALTIGTIIDNAVSTQKSIRFAGLSPDIFAQFELLSISEHLLEDYSHRTLLSALESC